MWSMNPASGADPICFWPDVILMACLSLDPPEGHPCIKKIKRLLSVIAESAPFTPDLKRLKRIVEIGDERTLKNYLKYLEDGGVIMSLTKKGSHLQTDQKH